MNKALQINLGGVPFTIDDDAYRRLDLYLHELEKYFEYSESRDEIISDIEARLAELLTEKLHGREILSIRDVSDAIKVMGSPGEFDDEPIVERNTSEKRKAVWDIQTGKKLFRDPDNKVIGGVCSGLAAYFGIQDAIWLRLGFVAVFLTMGVGFVLYLVAWALIPEAKTSADRLAMIGHPANVKNIAHMIERGLDDLSETIKDNWEDFKSKKKTTGRRGRARFMQESDPFGLHVLDRLPEVTGQIEQQVIESIDSVTTKLNNLDKAKDHLYV